MASSTWKTCPSTSADAASPGLAIAQRLTIPVMVLAATAAATGLFWPAVYRETAWVIPQNRGQDLVTLFVVAVMVPVLAGVRGGSPGALLAWLGLLGYLSYTYTGAAFSYAFNAWFPVYVALFSLTGATLIAGLSSIDAAAVRRAFDADTPRRGVAAFLAGMAAMLCLLWLGQIVPFYTEGRLPPLVVLADTPTVFVYVLDLGVVVPLALVSARWLWRDRPWGYVLAGFVLIKAATMGLALLSMTAFALRAGQETEWFLAGIWVVLAASGGAMSAWFFKHCRRG